MPNLDKVKKDKSKVWKVIGSEYLVKNDYLRLKRDRCLLPNGHICDEYYVVEKNDGVLVFATTKKKKILVISQYKHGGGEVIIEIPAGRVEENEDFMDAGKRELLEETGYSADKFEYLGFLKFDASSTKGICHVLYCKDAKKTGPQHLEKTEDITVHEVSRKELYGMLMKGTVNVGIIVGAMFLGLERMKKDEKNH